MARQELYDRNHEPPSSLLRRALLKGAVAAGLTSSLADALRGADSIAAGPQAGDVFVFFSGDHAGQVIKPTDLIVGASPVMAWPKEPVTDIVRDESRLSLVLLVRLEAACLDEVTALRAAEGLVAYSATCTHAQCPVTGWNDEKKAFSCPCHQSEYDPSQNAKVLSGPAPRALPALPVKIENNVLVAAGAFIGRPGARST
jgi:rieske iron-sulfur protein